MGQVLVTGACGGIGKAVVFDLLESGYSIFAVDQDQDLLDRTFADCKSVSTYAADLSKEDSIRNLVQRSVEEGGPISGMVHCAGFDKLSPLYLNKRETVERLFNIHVYAAMDLCKYIAKKGNAADNCSIVLISSLAAHEGAEGHTAYAAAKGALEGFLASAAIELAERKIRINEVVLGVVQTNMSNGYISKLDDTQKQELLSQYPLGLGVPEDVSKMIAFLISEKASWVTGQKFILDGGHSIRKV